MKAKHLSQLLCLLLLTSNVPGALGQDKGRYVFTSTYTFENRGDEPYVVTEYDAELPLFFNNRWQEVTIRESSHDILEEILDEDGNRIAIIDLPHEIPAGGMLVFSVEYIIESEEMPRAPITIVEAGEIDDIPEMLVELYTSESETFRRDEDIEALALRLAANSTDVLDVVTTLVGWVVSNVEYCNFEVPLYPDETLGDLEGDCDDQAILLISMLRILGIPAFLQVGAVFSESISSEKSSWEGHLTFQQEGMGWHGWAMVYIPPWGWIPVDLTLTNAPEPFDMIIQAPEYEENIVAAFNVSRQPYIGESRLTREQIMASDLYITVSDTAVEQPIRNWMFTPLYIGLGLVAGTAIVAIVVLVTRRRS